MEFGAVFEIILAIIAVVGYGCLAYYFSETKLFPKNTVYAMTIFDDESYENAEMIFRAISKGLWKKFGGRICVIMYEKYALNAEYMKLFEQYDVRYYIVKQENTENNSDE